MKVLLTGATGTIGGAIFRHLDKHPSISSIVALTRRPFDPPSSKCTNIVINDFNNWESDVLASVADSDAMVWAMGTSDTNKDVNYKYIKAFQEAFCNVASVGRERRFRYVLVSGALVEPDQEKTLYFMAGARKLKGLTETWSLEFAKRNEKVWQTWIVKPGGVITDQTWRVAKLLAGIMMPMICDEEVGAFVADLVVRGTEPEGRIFNERMVARGSELLSLSSGV